MAKQPEAIRHDGVISNKAVLGIHAESQRDVPGLWIIQTTWGQVLAHGVQRATGSLSKPQWRNASTIGTDVRAC